MCTTGHTVKDWLQSLDGFWAIALHWCFYGSSGHITEPKGLTIENFLHRAPASFYPQMLCKSFVRVPFTHTCANAHLFLRDGVPMPYVDCNGGPVQWESFGQDHTIGPWRINHYFVRSREWWQQKIARWAKAGGFSRSPEEFEAHDRNEHYDPAALVYVPAVKAALRLLGLAPPQAYTTTSYLADLCWLMANRHLEIFREQNER